MSVTLTALLPILYAIVLGFFLRKAGLVKEDHWRAVEHVSYYVLFPAIIAFALLTADFGDAPVLSMTLAIFAGLATLHALMWMTRPLLQTHLGIDGPAFTSVFQGAGRWHTFVGLAILPALFGPQGLAFGAIATLGIVPLSNAGSVAVLAKFGDRSEANRPSLLKSLITNPFLLAIAVAGTIRLSGIELPRSVVESLELIGRGALGLALMSVGAGLRLDQVHGQRAALVLSVLLKLCVLPLLMFCWTVLLGVDGIPQTVAIIAGAMPTSSAAYILARQMGGDAPLIANIMTLQVLCAAVSLPVILWILA